MVKRPITLAAQVHQSHMTGSLHSMPTTNEPIVCGMNYLQQHLQWLLLIILSYSAVYCGNQQRSYHGTTVQIVQPNSLLEIYHGNRMCTTTSILPPATFSEQDQHIVLQSTDTISTSNAVPKRAFEQSPGSSSPHKVGKIGSKRPRTVAVRQLTSSLVKDTTSSTRQLHTQTLTMEDFEESKQEGDEQLLMSHKLFSYVALKYVAHHCQDFNCTLSDMIV